MSEVLKKVEKDKLWKKIGFETVSVRVPKDVLEYLRKTQGDAVEWIELEIVDCVRAEIEGKTSQEWAETFGLTGVFYEVLGEEQYKQKQN